MFYVGKIVPLVLHSCAHAEAFASEHRRAEKALEVVSQINNITNLLTYQNLFTPL